MVLRWVVLSNSSAPGANYSEMKIQLHPKDGAWATAIILTPHHFHYPIHPQLWVIKIAFSLLHYWQMVQI